MNVDILQQFSFLTQNMSVNVQRHLVSTKLKTPGKQPTQPYRLESMVEN
jgi:hypothetical protein